ncbi:MAG: hypothetical protein KBD26_03445 [Candidatus Pacebacteria bacterium]|nr:hypothetical protein [Candidatus Paceibacterota bacterium]MBP9772861.1 hypothetical protein [Candidatus Paceibacterota bacterium]
MFQNLFRKARGLRFPKKQELAAIPHYLTRKEWVVFVTILTALVITTFIILGKINSNFIIEVPASGGSITEGIVGTPRFVNPVLALSDTDDDLVSVVFSGLVRKMPDGSIVPDLAESYEISSDGLTYTFKLHEKLTFHDGEPLTADDVIFTIEKIQDPLLKSPRRVEWEGVEVEKIDDLTISFTLRQRFASFLDNATIGILPYHIWKDIPIEEWNFSEYNSKAIGSGPYLVKDIDKKSSGAPSSYTLKSFSKFTLGKPFVNRITFNFYVNEDDMIRAYKNRSVESMSAITPEKARELEESGARIETTTLPRIFGLFFNQNQSPVFLDKSVISAFNTVIDKDRIINEVLYNYGKTIDSPIPKTLLDGTSFNTEETKMASIDEAVSILEKNGWSRGEDGIMIKKGKSGNTRLEFSISTGDAPELKRSGEIIKENLEAIGADVELKIFEIGVLNQNVIRPRKYDVLLFGQIISTENDLFAFWHSSQRNDPGLNIALYTNTKADTYLEKAQGLLSSEDRLANYVKFEQVIKDDNAAVFIYSPDFIYVLPKKLKGLTVDHIVEPHDRLATVYKWYIESDAVWKIFARSNE